jgi:rfaE bifunctional protein kinase chain/domain
MAAPLNIDQKRFEEIITKFKEIDPVIVLGDVGVDKYTYGEVDRISPEAPVPVLNVQKEWLKLGMAANISHNLKTLSIDSSLFGIMGEDDNSKHLENLLEDNELKTWGMVSLSDRLTTFKERVLTGVQQICRVDYETIQSLNDEECKKVQSRLTDLYEGHSAVILEDYAKGMITPDLAKWAIEFFNSKGIFIAVDPGRKVPARTYTGASLLKPNYKEAIELAESLGHYTKDPNQIAKLLSEELNIGKIVITLGGEGILIYESDQPEKSEILPTIKTEVFDVSGAGDTVISLLTSAIVAGSSLKEAAIIANCGAGVVVAKKGTATVNQEELAKYFQRYVKVLSQ